MVQGSIDAGTAGAGRSVVEQPLGKITIPAVDGDDALNRRNIALEKSNEGKRVDRAEPKQPAHEQELEELHGHRGNYNYPYKFSEIK